MTTVPVTAFVRPTTSLLIHSAVSRIRNPAADPAPACHVPFSDPDGALTVPAGRASGAGDGWSLMAAATAADEEHQENGHAAENPAPPVAAAR